MIELLAIQDPPPYVQFAAEAEALGRLSFLGGFCIGTKILEGDPADIEALAEDFDRRATLAGVNGPLMVEAINRGIDREEAAIDLILDMGPEDGSEQRQRREAQMVEYVGNGCGDLVVDYPDVFSIPAND